MDDKKIDKLNTLLEKRISFKRNFLIGVVTGIGSVLGAALVGSLITWVIISNIEKIPIMRDIIPTEVLREYIGVQD